MPNSSNIIFYSTKYDRFSKEKFVIELCIDGERIAYILNSETRLFEQEKQKGKDAQVDREIK